MERKPHISDDMRSRRLKALKIERLLDLKPGPQPLRMLEVGTGSGGIANYFGTHPSLACDVDAIDVHDNRVVLDGYRFRLVADTTLPFADAAFDVVISNHVMEHVGDENAQREHLAELRRVLAPGGVGYLAVPNRWMIVEPHYRVPFLSWLPRSWRSGYLRLFGKGSFYDVEPLQLRQLEKLLQDADLRFENLCLPALRATIELEDGRGALLSILKTIPDSILVPFRRLVPTLIYRFHR